MKMIRNVYLLLVMALACVHMFLTLSPATAPAFAPAAGGTPATVWFVALFAGWIVVAMFDLVMSMLELLPLSFALEAIMCNASLVILSVLNGGLTYVLLAIAVPTLVLIKALQTITGHGPQLHHI